MVAVWHIWAIKLNRFDKVEEHIKSLPEIEEYLYPTTTKEYKSKHGVKKKRIPLYSGYLFMKYEDSPDIFYKLNTYPFITTYVGKCTKADSEKVRDVKNLEYMNYINKVVHVDDVVRINSGPFKDLQGAIISTTSTNVCVALFVFGRVVNVTFNKDDVDIIHSEVSCGE